jgi:hypothetical protein
MKCDLKEQLPREAQAALAHLAVPWACARKLKFDPWDFALRLLQLQKLGVSESDLRWLVFNGYVDQADEETTFRDPARRFQPRANVPFSAETCFVLSEKGALVAGEGSDCRPSSSSDFPQIVPLRSQLPHWDRKLRLLLLNGCVVKRFRRPANNQELVLSVFEEEGWPPSIDDPLPFVRPQRPKERLHATIRCLNSNHENRLIRFRGNGTGEGVFWEPIPESAVERPTAFAGFRRAA